MKLVAVLVVVVSLLLPRSAHGQDRRACGRRPLGGRGELEEDGALGERDRPSPRSGGMALAVVDGGPCCALPGFRHSSARGAFPGPPGGSLAGRGVSTRRGCADQAREFA